MVTVWTAAIVALLILVLAVWWRRARAWRRLFAPGRLVGLETNVVDWSEGRPVPGSHAYHAVASVDWADRAGFSLRWTLPDDRLSIAQLRWEQVRLVRRTSSRSVTITFLVDGGPQ